MNTRLFLTLLTLCGLGLAAAPGCQRQEEIRQYRVPKPEVLTEVNKNEVSARRPPQPAPEARDRMLGAIVPHESSYWFFKLVGPKDLVAEKSAAFKKFVETLKFDDAKDSAPQWTLPDGWVAFPGSEMRYATIQIPAGDKPLELTVVTLDKSRDESEDIRLNVNRWRRQLKLSPLDMSELADATTTLKLDGFRARFVDFVGEMTAAPMGPAFHGGGDGK